MFIGRPVDKDSLKIFKDARFYHRNIETPSRISFTESDFIILFTTLISK